METMLITDSADFIACQMLGTTIEADSVTNPGESLQK